MERKETSTGRGAAQKDPVRMGRRKGRFHFNFSTYKEVPGREARKGGCQGFADMPPNR